MQQKKSSVSPTRNPTVGSFQQHVTCSTATGIVIGGIAYHLGFSMPTCLLSGGLCSMAGMLPDIDSDSSRSFQECIYFAAGLCAVLLVERLRQFDLDKDIILLSGSAMFLFVRFGVGELIKKLTAHRGMFHSIPAAILSGELVFFLSTGTVSERVFKAIALTAGYLSHLILDEICSIDSTGAKLRLKKSFGTALKLFDSKRAGTALALYAVVVFLGVTAMKNPEFIEELDGQDDRLLAEGQRLAPHPIGGIFDFLAALESEAVSALGGEKKNAVFAQNGVSASAPEPISSGNNAEASIAISNVPSATIVSGSQRNAEHRLFSKLKNEESAPAIPLESISMPNRSIDVVATSSSPQPQASPSSFQQTAFRSGSPEPPVRIAQNIPAVEGNNDPRPMTASPFGLSGSDFAPRGVQRIPMSSHREPAPIRLQ